jgi:hypothetical protein
MVLNSFGEAIPSEQGSDSRFDSLSGLRPDLFTLEAVRVGLPALHPSRDESE